MFSLKWLDAAKETYDELKAEAKEIVKTRSVKGKKKSTKQEGLFKQVHKALSLLSSNPKHPSLQTHVYPAIDNLYDPAQKVFEAYAQNQTPGAYRVFWCYGPGKKEITIIAITPYP
ncbi:MAG: hypothetical protein EXR98_12550 [Gemmataceae bacterium]|nr:hypothetical protein [Gemmataceae bacterium]